MTIRLFFKVIRIQILLMALTTCSNQIMQPTAVPSVKSLNPTNKSSGFNSTGALFSLPGSYTKEQRPSKNGEATIIYSTIHVQAINPIKAADMDFRWERNNLRMDMTLTQRWTDDRLQFAEEWFDKLDHIILPIEFVDQIWNPHPFVVNAKSTDVGQFTQRLVSVYIFKNHTVQYSVNVFATVACAMNYRYYPMDSQLCPMYIESFSFDEAQVRYLWADADAFTINPKLRMLQFVPRRPLHYTEASVPRFNEAKNFSQLIAYFRFDRLLGNHLIQTFAPCSLVVCLSWFSFWLELNALSARMSLLVTSILTLVTQFAGLKADLPPVAYIKAVDIWMAGCMVWVFGALGEFVLAKVIYSLTEDAKFHFHEDHMLLRARNGATLGKNKVSEGDATDRAERVSEGPPRNVLTAGSGNLSRTRKRTVGTLARQESFDSSTTTSSATLEKNLGKMHIPLQWTDPKTGKLVLLWKRVDNFSKWVFPVSFVIFCTIYWIVLYIHSITSNEELDHVISANATV